jgi:hypothetical protein
MNERIRELADEAGMYDFVLEAMGIGEEWEKFAELIVRECMAKVCEELDNSYSEDGKEILNERVLEHFGVEE